MNYLLRNSRRGSGLRKPIINVLVVLALAGFFYFFAPRLANQSLYAFARPIWSARDYVTGLLANLKSLFSSKETLAAQNLSLERKLKEARVALLDLDAYRKENDELKRLLGRNPAEKKVLALILAKPNRSLYDTLVLDVGANQGVKEGDKVYYGDFVIGAVRAVYAGYSKAVLASSAGETLTVRIATSSIDTEAAGRGGGNFIAKLPKEIPIKLGDLIKSVGPEPRFFGAVEDIERTETSSFQFVLFKLPVNINTLEWVEVSLN
ncbi:MAG: rod shape-determining protein MreC [Candidatus Taylorbacteria bacterium]|nr:rod shape-determining protein MreC [Candidatus Taylorbacteria bacterium]